MWRKICAESSRETRGRDERAPRSLSEDQIQTKSATKDKPPELWRYHHKFVGPWGHQQSEDSKRVQISWIATFNFKSMIKCHMFPKVQDQFLGEASEQTCTSPFHMKRKNSIQVPPLSPLSRSALVMSERAALGTWTSSSSKLKRRGVENKRRIQIAWIATFNFKSTIKCHMFPKVQFLGEASEQTCTSPLQMKRKTFHKCHRCLHFWDPFLSRENDELLGLGLQVQATWTQVE